MKKIIRLTESDLVRIVKRVLIEQEGDPMEGMKLTDINFPEYGLMGKRPDPNLDIEKTGVGDFFTPEDWIGKGQIKLSNGKSELIILGDNKLGPKLSPLTQIGKIESANQYCKGVTFGEKIPKDCTVFIKLGDDISYECNSLGCSTR
jgi:hypothetical protein